MPWDGSITAMSGVCLTPQDFPRIMRENQQEKGKSYEKDLSHTSWKTEQYFVQCGCSTGRRGEKTGRAFGPQTGWIWDTEDLSFYLDPGQGNGTDFK